jgi:4-aminobutyrate aminotransferase/(S)-3-amino-2-methylpropionate transaminase
VLQVIEEEGLVERAEIVGKTIRSRWDDLSDEIEEIGEVRGVGAMIGVEFVRDRGTKEPNGEYLSALMQEAMRRGVVTVSCGAHHNVLRHLVPLVISDPALDEALDILSAAASVTRGKSAPIHESSEGD